MHKPFDGLDLGADTNELDENGFEIDNSNDDPDCDIDYNELQSFKKLWHQLKQVDLTSEKSVRIIEDLFTLHGVELEKNINVPLNTNWPSLCQLRQTNRMISCTKLNYNFLRHFNLPPYKTLHQNYSTGEISSHTTSLVFYATDTPKHAKDNRTEVERRISMNKDTIMQATSALLTLPLHFKNLDI